MNSLEPVPVWFALMRSIDCAYSVSVRKRAEGMSESRKNQHKGEAMTVMSPTKRKMICHEASGPDVMCPLRVSRGRTT